MAENKIDTKQIEQLAALVASYDLGEILIEQDGLKIKIAAKKPAPAATVVSAAPAAPTVAAASVTSVEPTAPAAPAAANGKQVVSPIVGTFYAAPSPDRDPFVTVGQRVKKGDVLFIVESMKLMNEIQSEFDGEVAQILCDDGQTVEYNQPVMVIK